MTDWFFIHFTSFQNSTSRNVSAVFFFLILFCISLIILL
uniref:Uncharacterized protein n=1 Tax=Siphoviridae sp. ctrgt10 TaxID=2826479 RepID=A0A8S5M7H3_9CAUD|nr:MAG TPA: hypothetical protein [Siphoviridae sp. ctrgt10]